jgi:hypothetical protein
MPQHATYTLALLALVHGATAFRQGLSLLHRQRQPARACCQQTMATTMVQDTDWQTANAGRIRYYGEREMWRKAQDIFNAVSNLLARLL